MKTPKAKKSAFTNERKDIDWVKIGQEYCAGASITSLSHRYGVSRPAIDKNIEKNQWKQDVSLILNKEVAAKVAGVTKGLTTDQKTEAIDNESNRRAEIAKEHQKEISDSRKIGQSLQSLLKVKVNELTTMAKNGKIDSKELDITIKSYANLQNAQVAAQEREAKANGIDLTLSNATNQVTMGDDAFADIIKLAASQRSKANNS
jgi:hypothetical protein